MSYELVKSWIDDQSSVTEDQINEAIEAMYLLPPSGPNQNLLAALGYIQILKLVMSKPFLYL